MALKRVAPSAQWQSGGKGVSPTGASVSITDGIPYADSSGSGIVTESGGAYYATEEGGTAEDLVTVGTTVYLREV